MPREDEKAWATPHDTCETPFRRNHFRETPRLDFFMVFQGFLFFLDL